MTTFALIRHASHALLGHTMVGRTPGAAADAGCRARSRRCGWVTLFDGKTLDGWVQRNGTASYRVADGAIVGGTSEGSVNSFLTTEQAYGDFELESEVRVDDALNSGIQIRSRARQRSTGEGADDLAGRVFGPQVEIEASPGLAGFIYGEATGRGWLSPQERLKPHEHFRNGDWNRYRIVARGSRIQTWLNGQPIEDLTDEATYRSHPDGFIGLQVHSIEPGTGPYEVAWRRLRLRELPASPRSARPVLPGGRALPRRPCWAAEHTPQAG